MAGPLNPDRETMEAWGQAVLGFVVDQLAGLAEAPASDYEGVAELVEALREGPGEGPRPLAELLAEVAAAASKGLKPGGPGYLAYIPGGGLYASALGTFLGHALNRYATIPRAGPGVAAIEASITRWLCDLFGYPSGSEGILTSGGSMANFSAIVTARAARLGEEFQDGVIYTGEYAHHSVAKAALLAGFPARQVRTVASGEDYRMDLEDLERRIAADRAAGLRPAILVGAAGTTDSGRIDDLAALADAAERHDLWLHHDAAYGGFFQLCERGAERLRGIERADSITLDPHKGLFLPFGTGALIVRDGAALAAGHGAAGHGVVGHGQAGPEEPGYLRDLESDYGLPEFAALSPELSRESRGLAVWLPLQLHGLDAFRRELDAKLDLALEADGQLRAIDGMTLLHPPDLSVVAFRYESGEARRDDAANARIQERVNASRRIVLSSTEMEGRVTLRFAILGQRTDRARVHEAVALVREAVAAERG